MDGYCTNEDGGRLGYFQDLGNIQSADLCLSECKRSQDATGCEYLFGSKCHRHTRKVTSSSGNNVFVEKCISFAG